MSDSVFSTVVTGVVVYVVGQIVLKRIIDPYVSYKEQLGAISALFLKKQAAIVGCRYDKEVIDELKCAAALLLSKWESVSFHNEMAMIRKLPENEAVLAAAHSMNLIAYYISEQQNKDLTNGPRMTPGDVYNEMKIIEKKLNIRISYQT
jgi:hypothetical protein